MDWSQVLTIVGSNVALFLWARAESRADARMMLTIIDGIKKDAADFHKLWAQESKDFHGRLCAIEERRNK